jgi:hypothetical protein
MPNDDFRTNFHPTSDLPADYDLLDAALEGTFPASDPLAVVLPRRGPGSNNHERRTGRTSMDDAGV